MLSSSQSIRDIAADQPSAVALFGRFEIDVCSLADKSLKEACSELQLSLDRVLEKLQECRDRESGAGPSDPSTLSCTHLIQHIVRVHHQRVRQDLPSLARQARKLADTVGDQSREFKAVEKLVEQLRRDMWAHIQQIGTSVNRWNPTPLPGSTSLSESLKGARTRKASRDCWLLNRDAVSSRTPSL